VTTVDKPALAVVVCGAGPASHVTVLVDLAQRDGWSVQLVATPIGMTFLDVPSLTAQTGAPVRDGYRESGQHGPRASAADALIVAPATFNTINKVAAGINDNYALNVIAEAIGRRTPVVILPFVNTALAARAPFVSALATLRAEGVRVIQGSNEWEPHPPGTGNDQLATYPWHRSLAAANEACQGHRATTSQPGHRPRGLVQELSKRDDHQHHTQ